MKSRNQSKFNTVFLVFFSISLCHLVFTKYHQSKHLSYWEQWQDTALIDFNDRIPSSGTEFNQDAIDNLKTYFNYSTFKKYVNYELSLNFRSDVEKLQDAKKWRPLFHRSLEKTLSRESQQAGNLESIFLTVFHDDLFHDFTKKFLEQLKLQNINSGKFQVDIVFKPELTPQFSYSSEISSNRLINWDETNLFRKNIEEQKKKHQTKLTQHIYETQLPNNSLDYQYKGGLISFWFELKENAQASGFVRFRKYYTAPHIIGLEPFIKDQEMQLSMIHYKSNKSVNGQLYLTSDFYQSFSLAHPKPKAERLELYFGKLLPNNLSVKNLGSRKVASLSTPLMKPNERERELKLGNLNFHGKLTLSEKDYPFTTTIESLIFDFTEGQFSQKSRIKTKFNEKRLKGQRKGSLKHKVSQKILHEYGLELIQQFKMNNLHPRFKGARGKVR